MKHISVITGIARHSFGASFIRNHIENKPDARLISFDRIPNPDFPQRSNIHESVICDLNPLTFPGGYDSFVKALSDQLSSACELLGGDPIGCLVQFAGTYEFGPFVRHDITQRQRVLGLNLLGITEMLHAVMTLNQRLKTNNGISLTHVLTGSFQALNMRAERALYAPSKAYGLDLCSALVRGKELAKCAYLAIGPMDTAMLHWNHWTAKARGADRFFQSVFSGDPSVYKSVFIECSNDALIAAAEPAFSSDLTALLATFEEYKAIRKSAFSSELGVLDPNACAKLLNRLLNREDFESGVYGFTAFGNAIIVKMTTFSALNRKVIFDTSAKILSLEP